MVRGRSCQRNASNLEPRESRRPGVLVVYRTLMQMRFQRGVTYTGERGQALWGTTSEVAPVSREMGFLIAARQAEDRQKSSNRRLRNSADHKKQGDN